MKIRINNIEFKNNKFLKWFPNEYFNQLEEYLKNGYEEKKGMIIRDNFGISKTLFFKEELCITIASLIKNSSNDYLETVGHRLLDLTIEERNDFFKIYQLAVDETN